MEMLREREDCDLHPYGRGGRFEGFLYDARRVKVNTDHSKLFTWLLFFFSLVLLSGSIIYLAGELRDVWERVNAVSDTSQLKILTTSVGLKTAQVFQAIFQARTWWRVMVRVNSSWCRNGFNVISGASRPLQLMKLRRCTFVYRPSAHQQALSILPMKFAKSFINAYALGCVSVFHSLTSTSSFQEKWKYSATCARLTTRLNKSGDELYKNLLKCKLDSSQSTASILHVLTYAAINCIRRELFDRI